MKPQFTVVTMLWVVAYFGFLLMVSKSVPVVERRQAVSRFGNAVRSEYVEHRRPPTAPETLRRMALFTAAITPVFALFLYWFWPRPDYPLLSLRSSPPSEADGQTANPHRVGKTTS